MGATLEKIREELKNNPIIRKYDENTPIKTTQEDIKKLQEILVQTVIDYARKHDLSDIDGIDFTADGLKESISNGQWVPCTDSAICVQGRKYQCLERKNGDVDKIPYRFIIGSYC